MSTAQEFLREVRDLADPKERLEQLESTQWRDDGEVAAARAWWHARFHFTNRKKTMAGDRYVWFLFTLRGWAKGRPTSGKKVIEQAYREAFLSPEMQAALALEDRFEAEMLDACVMYIETINTDPSFLGIKFGRARSRGEVRERVAELVANEIMAAVYALCGHQQHSGAITRCIWKGAEQAYPGITPVLERVVRACDDGQMRDFLLSAIAD